MDNLSKIGFGTTKRLIRDKILSNDVTFMQQNARIVGNWDTADGYASVRLKCSKL